MCSTGAVFKTGLPSAQAPLPPGRRGWGRERPWEGEALQGWAELPGQTQEGRTECAGKTASG